MAGVRVDFEAEPSATIRDCKKKISDKNDSIPFESLGLIINGSRPKNSDTLESLGIADGATFHVVRQLKSMHSLNETHAEQQAAAAAAAAAAPSAAPTPQQTTTLPSISTTRAPAPAPTPQPAPSPQRGIVMSTQVPVGALPGQQIQVRTADGRVLRVVVPPGCYPGSSFQFQVPPPQQQRMVLTCPGGAGPGARIQVSVPGGRIVTVQVPQGVYPGMQFQILV